MAMTCAALRRLEVWSDLACAGGVRRAILQRLLACTATATLTGEDRLRVLVDATDPALAHVAAGAVLRVDQDDTTWDEWLVMPYVADPGAGTVEITAIPAGFARLATAALVRQVTLSNGLVVHDFEAVGLTAAEQLSAYILPSLTSAGVGYFATGDTPGTRTDVAFAWDTPLSALRKLAEALGGLEVDVRRNGTTGYFVDLVAKVNASAAVSDVQLGKNLLAMKRTRDRAPQLTRVFPRGSAEDGVYVTMGDAVWQVASKSGNTLNLVDPAGGAGPLLTSDQLVDWRVFSLNTGGITRVAGGSVGIQAIDCDNASGINVGDLVGFRRAIGSDLVQPTYIDHPAAVTAYGPLVGVLDRPDIPATVNLQRNPVGRDWPSGGVPAGHTVLSGATCTKETGGAFTRMGGASIKVVATVAGQGVQTPLSPMPCSTRAPYVSGYARLLVTAGQVKVVLVTDNLAGDVRVWPLGTVASSSQVGSWLDLGVSGIDGNAIGVRAAYLKIEALGAATFYVDGCQLTNTPSQMPFLEGAGPTMLWQAANAELSLRAAPGERYDLALADVRRGPSLLTVAPDFVVGGTVHVRDARLTPTENLLAGGMLDRDTDGNGYCDAWTDNDAGAGTMTYDAAHRAQRIVAAVNGGPSLRFPGVSQTTDLAVRHGDTVRVDGEVRTENIGGGSFARAFLHWLDANGAYIDQAGSNSITGNSPFVPFSIEAVAPAGARRVRLILAGVQAVGGSITAWYRRVSARVTTPVLVSTRITALERDYLTPANGRLTLSSQPDDLVSDLSRVPGGRRVPATVREAAAALLYCECRAIKVGGDAASVVIQVDAFPADATVQWVSGGTREAGPTAGVASANGQQWTFARPAFGAGDDVPVFRAERAGFQSDTDTFTIPEQGRDTVPLATRVRVIAQTATSVDVRVSCSSPQYAGSLATIASTGATVTALGGDNLITIQSTVGSEGDFEDYRITRPSAGAGVARVVFTVTPNDPRIAADQDAVDVPPAESLATRINVLPVHVAGADVYVKFEVFGAAGTELSDPTGIVVTITRTQPNGTVTTSTPAVTWNAGEGLFEAMVTRVLGDAYSATIACTAIAGRQAASATASIPSYVISGAPRITAFSASASTSTDEITVSWTLADAPSGYVLSLDMDDESDTPAANNFAPGDYGASPYVFDTLWDVVGSGGTLTRYRFRAQLRLGDRVLAEADYLLVWRRA